MQFFGLRCARSARCLVVLAALAVPLVGASVAQAALAGANPLTTTNRPDLRTVTITSASTAQFCFDQPITQVPSQSSFSLGGYSALNFLTSTNPTTIDSTNNRCVDATFPISIGDTDDLSQFTIGQVAESAVLTQVGSGLVGNRSDSTALQGSNTHNGTAGHTVAPDLTGVTVDNVNTGNTLDYIYDQNVRLSSVVVGDFIAYYADGTPLVPASAVAGGNVVKVTFATPLSDPTHGPTVIAAERASAVASQTADHQTDSIDSFPVSGTSGATTTRPDLIAAQLSTNGAFIDYTFDKPVAGTGITLPATANTNFGFVDAESFTGTANCAETATSARGTAGPISGPCVANTQLPNNVVRAYFDNSSFGDVQAFYEYGVKATVSPGAARTGAGVGNGFGEAPIGDNQGAFAEGFTTGPDAFRVTFDNATNTATVLFDSRVFATVPSSFVLLDANGTPLPGGTGVQAGPPATLATTPGSYLITISFTGASVANAKALEIKGPLATPAVSAAIQPGASGIFDAFSVQQIVSPTGAAAILKPGSKLRFVKVAAHSKKHTKTHKKHKKG